MGVEINFRDIDKFKRLQKNLKNPEKIYKAIADLELSQTLVRYKREVDPQGKRWKATIRSIKKGGKILIDTAVMFNSIGRRFSKYFALVGTNIKYAKYHQDGGVYNVPAHTRKSSTGKIYSVRSYDLNTPQRAFLGINKKTIENVTAVINKFWKDSLR